MSSPPVEPERETGAAWSLRPMEARDDVAVAAIIRSVMPEFGASGEGFAINDPEVDWMSRAYAAPRSAYFVIEHRGAVCGGGGVAPLENGPPDVCELRKMYFLPELRGLGAGSALLRHCLDVARAFGFQRCYLETLFRMHAARRLYEREGFLRIDAPMGNTGHGSCDAYYLREL